jgi:hypothetical protein
MVQLELGGTGAAIHRLLIVPKRDRAMLNRVWNAIAHARPAGVSSRHAPSRVERHRTCPPGWSVVAPCSIACGTPSHMPSRLECRRAMLNRGWNAIAHAQPAGVSSRHAPSRVERHRAGPPSRNVIAPCSIAGGMSSRVEPCHPTRRCSRRRYASSESGRF